MLNITHTSLTQSITNLRIEEGSFTGTPFEVKEISEIALRILEDHTEPLTLGVSKTILLNKIKNFRDADYCLFADGPEMTITEATDREGPIYSKTALINHVKENWSEGRFEFIADGPEFRITALN